MMGVYRAVTRAKIYVLIHGAGRGEGRTKRSQNPSLCEKFRRFTKVNSKWLQDQNVKCKTIKLFKGGIGEILYDLGYESIVITF
jgi:hypothetical protein